jgi:hypothetical protein
VPQPSPGSQVRPTLGRPPFPRRSSGQLCAAGLPPATPQRHRRQVEASSPGRVVPLDERLDEPLFRSIPAPTLALDSRDRQPLTEPPGSPRCIPGPAARFCQAALPDALSSATRPPATATCRCVNPVRRSRYWRTPEASDDGAALFEAVCECELEALWRSELTARIGRVSAVGQRSRTGTTGPTNSNASQRSTSRASSSSSDRPLFLHGTGWRPHVKSRGS